MRGRIDTFRSFVEIRRLCGTRGPSTSRCAQGRRPRGMTRSARSPAAPARHCLLLLCQGRVDQIACLPLGESLGHRMAQLPEPPDLLGRGRLIPPPEPLCEPPPPLSSYQSSASIPNTLLHPQFDPNLASPRTCGTASAPARRHLLPSAPRTLPRRQPPQGSPSGRPILD